MKPGRLFRPALLVAALWAGGTADSAAAWSLRGGEAVSGEAVAFDYGAKTVTFRDPVSEQDFRVPARGLSLRSKQRLLFSSLFFRGEAVEALLSPAKRRLLLSTLGTVAAAAGLGFWATARLLVGGRSLLLAAFGFAGTWVILAIFVICYAFLKMRLNGGAGIVLLGTAVSIGLTPLYISAVYHCGYFRALLVLLLHLVAGTVLLASVLLVMELASGSERAEYWWNVRVFEPVGLIEAHPRTGR